MILATLILAAILDFSGVSSDGLAVPVPESMSFTAVDVSRLPAEQAFLRDLVLDRAGLRTPPSADGRALSVVFELDPSLEGERAVVAVSNGTAHVRGGRVRALVFGAGKLLRTIRWGESSFAVADGVYEFAPKGLFRQCYLARHFDNWYHRASPDELTRYVEDLALWGMNAIEAQLAYSVVDAAKATPTDRASFAAGSVALSEACRRLDLDLTAGGGSNVGPGNMPASFRAVPNKEPWRGMTEFNVCPERLGATDYLLDLRRGAVGELSGLRVSGFVYWPFDEGGCACADCSPWGGRGYVKLIEKCRAINEAAFPNCLHLVSTWLFKDDDWEWFYRYLEKQDWIDYLIVDSHEDFPKYPLEHPVPKDIPVVTFPEISMWGRFPWGGTGANPLPARFERLFRQASKVARGFSLYSEGLFEDFNKIVVNGLYVDPSTTAEAVAREYANWELPGCDASRFVAFVRLLESDYQTRVEGRGLTRGNSISWYLEHADAGELARRAKIAAKAAELAEEIDRAILPTMRYGWRWRLLYLRAKIDAVVYATRNLRDPRVLPAYAEMVQLYHAERQAAGLKNGTWRGFTCPPVADDDAWLRPKDGASAKGGL